MEDTYRVKLSVLQDSLEYYSDVESDGYYVVKGTNEIIAYGEGLSEWYVKEDETWAFLQSNECLRLPTMNDIDDSSDWGREITLRYINEKIEDVKQKKHLTKAYKSIFDNRILPSFPGSTKFCSELGKLGLMEEWNQFVNESHQKRELEYITSWCQEHDVEIEYDI